MLVLRPKTTEVISLTNQRTGENLGQIHLINKEGIYELGFEFPAHVRIIRQKRGIENGNRRRS